jgi:ArsR family transcriptional regulator
MNETSQSTGTTSAETASEGCCTGAPAVDEEAVAADVQLLSALGNDTRYELLRRISASDGGVCVCDLEGAVGISQSGVSQALSRLYAAGLVSRRKEGSWRYYESTPVAETLLSALDALRGDR